MDIPEIKSSEDIAIDVVTNVVNKAQERLGLRKTLQQIAHYRDIVGRKAILTLASLPRPLPSNAEKFIKQAIEKTWRLTEALHYHLKYLGGSQDEVSQYYYFEAIFSQPTSAYPIPQATVSVFFRLEDRHVEPVHIETHPTMIFRIEGFYTDHDIRNIKLTVDMILAALAMKIKMFDRIEYTRMF